MEIENNASIEFKWKAMYINKQWYCNYRCFSVLPLHIDINAWYLKLQLPESYEVWKWKLLIQKRLCI